MTADEIAAELKADIMAGRIPPGTELRQEGIALRFGVSRMPVRDALNLLAVDRLVRLRRNRGAQVIRFSAEELAQVFHMRHLLEADLLRHAIDRYDEDALQRLKHEMHRCEVEAGHPDFPAADWRFHAVLYAPSGMELQIATVQELRLSAQVHVAVYDDLRQSETQWNDDHRRIVAAVEARDSDEAVRALHAHLTQAEAALRAAMGGVRP
ncbi:GntR family transcriptional regulator [Chachezhania sediminis]|uniref:GntR family transcriptional regulator n=1 Tax=Chachezhania sediminis TaxID=2599291 RepID=UPI00131B9B7E|nr:GntR family transcriptional regulator [Chachezhania sediminis]